MCSSYGGLLSAPLDGFLRDYRRCRCHRPRGPAHMRRHRSQADAARARDPSGSLSPPLREWRGPPSRSQSRGEVRPHFPPPADSCTCISTAWTPRTSPLSSTGRMLLERWHRGRCPAEGITPAWQEVACDSPTGVPAPQAPRPRDSARSHNQKRGQLVTCYTPGSCRGRYHTDRQPGDASQPIQA
jgi:hypothetical protein